MTKSKAFAGRWSPSRIVAAAIAATALLFGALVAPSIAVAAPADVDASPASFTTGEPRLDTAGNVIQAHGGQVVAATDDAGERIWYWYGEDRTNGYFNAPGVHVYSSYDLHEWTDRGLALRTMNSTDQFADDPYFAELYGSYTDDERAAVFRDLDTSNSGAEGETSAILERPKVIYNEATGQWVLWVHADGPTETSTAQYAKAKAGVAVSDSPFGPFRYIDSYRLHVAPEGEENYDPANPGMARDMNLFVDDDGTGYIIYSSEENYSLFISKLDASYTALATPAADAVKGVDFIRPYIGGHREAPALFKRDDTYYLITSGATGWDPNPASYATATEILGEWTDRGNPAVGEGAATTHRSQSTSVIPYDPENGKFIYMGDRWIPSDQKNSPYIWLPLEFGEGGSMTLPDPGQWTLDDLQVYEPWNVTTVSPEQVLLGDTSSLPETVEVESDGTASAVAVTWDAASVASPGVQNVRGTLSDGRAFERSILVVASGLRYVVNAGGFVTDDWARTVQIAEQEGELLNSSPEQAIGVDPETGATWGYSGDSGVYGDESSNMYTSLRWAKNSGSLEYSFSGLEPGEHTVHLGYFDPWNDAGRRANVAINGAVVESNRPYAGGGSSGTYENITVGADGTVDIRMTEAANPDIQVSFIMIAETAAEEPDPPVTGPGSEPGAEPGSATGAGSATGSGTDSVGADRADDLAATGADAGWVGAGGFIAAALLLVGALLFAGARRRRAARGKAHV